MTKKKKFGARCPECGSDDLELRVGDCDSTGCGVTCFCRVCKESYSKVAMAQNFD